MINRRRAVLIVAGSVLLAAVPAAFAAEKPSMEPGAVLQAVARGLHDGNAESAVGALDVLFSGFRSGASSAAPIWAGGFRRAAYDPCFDSGIGCQEFPKPPKPEPKPAPEPKPDPKPDPKPAPLPKPEPPATPRPGSTRPA